MCFQNLLRACALAASVVALQAGPIFVNGLAIPGSLGDQFGTGANNGRVGFFSDLHYDRVRNEWWGLSDRGPGGGTIAYDTRVQRFSVDVDLNTGAVSNFQVLETVRFFNGASSMNGLAPSPTNTLGNSFDPEGFVIIPSTGHMLVSDEYGPSLYEFDRNGQLVRTFTTPANLVPRSGANVPNFASDAGNTQGKRTNRGFEGLTISNDGRYAYAMLQSAMLDEGGSSGVYNRIVKFDVATGTAVAQFAYRMDTAGQGRGISALLWLNDNEFLVLERNNRGIGVGAELTPADKRVYRINLAGATDVTANDLDAPGALFTAVTKDPTVFIDLDANTLAALGNKSPEKWEGLAIGPQLNDGNYIILAGTDNDYSVTQNGSNVQFDVYFNFADGDPYASSIQCPLGTTTGCFLTSNNATPATLTANHQLVPGILHAYRSQTGDLATYEPVPEPATLSLLAAGALLAAAAAKRKAA